MSAKVSFSLTLILLFAFIGQLAWTIRYVIVIAAIAQKLKHRKAKVVGSPNAKRHSNNLGNVIDFTQPGHNTYIRGMHNNLGSTPPVGHLSPGTYMPQSNVITSDGQ